MPHCSCNLQFLICAPCCRVAQVPKRLITDRLENSIQGNNAIPIFKSYDSRFTHIASRSHILQFLICAACCRVAQVPKCPITERLSAKNHLIPNPNHLYNPRKTNIIVRIGCSCKLMHNSSTRRAAWYNTALLEVGPPPANFADLKTPGSSGAGKPPVFSTSRPARTYFQALQRIGVGATSRSI